MLGNMLKAYLILKILGNDEIIGHLREMKDTSTVNTFL